MQCGEKCRSERIAITVWNCGTAKTCKFWIIYKIKPNDCCHFKWLCKSVLILMLSLIRKDYLFIKWPTVIVGRTYGPTKYCTVHTGHKFSIFYSRLTTPVPQFVCTRWIQSRDKVRDGVRVQICGRCVRCGILSDPVHIFFSLAATRAG